MQRYERFLDLGESVGPARADQGSEYWTDVAKRGFPSSFGTPFWPQTETDFVTVHKCGFWAALQAAG
jgi:hypothetical protein